jgi:hypothetical protein
MENLGTYFLIALAIAFVIYYSNKKKTNAPKAKAPAKPRAAAAAKPNTKKPLPKKGGPKQNFLGARIKLAARRPSLPLHLKYLILTYFRRHSKK